MLELIEYKNLEWYVMNETDKGKLLLLRDSFTSEQTLKYFKDKEMLEKFSDGYYVRYNKKYRDPWWRNSYIKEGLNTLFLSDLDINDLIPMETTLYLGDKSDTTKDYVRLLTKDEFDTLEVDVLKTERVFGYWTMTPEKIYRSYASVFYVYGSTNPGYLSDNGVHGSYAVRPVVYLKSGSLNSGITSSSTPNQALLDAFAGYEKVKNMRPFGRRRLIK